MVRIAHKHVIHSDPDMNRAEAKIIADVDTHGWHVMNVMPGEPHPPHSFSIGLQRTFGHPEIVILGLRGEIAQVLINDIGLKIRDGHAYEPGARYPGIIKGFSVSFANVSVEHFSEYLGFALWFYGGEPFAAIQMVWPDGNGAFPWEASFNEELRSLQPLLGVVA
jgi:hypothetical protein